MVNNIYLYIFIIRLAPLARARHTRAKKRSKGQQDKPQKCLAEGKIKTQHKNGLKQKKTKKKK
jgi:hypothetical protein